MLKETAQIYNKIMESQGEKVSDLLGVLNQGMYHNIPNSYQLAMVVEVMTGGLE